MSAIFRTAEQTEWAQLALSGIAYTFSTNFLNLTLTAETDLVLIQNPLTSTKLLRFWEQLHGYTHASAGNYTIVRVYRNPTVSLAGTPIVVSNVRSEFITPTQAVVSTLPTIVGRGTLLTTLVVPIGSYNRQLDLARFLSTNTTLLITGQSSANNGMQALTATWAEVTG